MSNIVRFQVFTVVVVVRSMDHIMMVICQVIHHEVRARSDVLVESFDCESTCGFKLIVKMRNTYLLKSKMFQKDY